jgi:hypothetical protein
MTGFIGGLAMNKILLILCIIISLLISCSPRGKDSETGKGAITNKSSESQIATDSQVIKLTVDLKKEKKLQQEVDKGHQPWRLEPIDVAYATISTTDKKVAYENCTLISETSNESVVRCKGEKMYVVYLKRLVREHGIWTAVQIEIK